MPYTPNQWVDDDKTRPLSAERLAHAETQYAQAMADVAAQVSDSESAIGAPLYASIAAAISAAGLDIASMTEGATLTIYGHSYTPVPGFYTTPGHEWSTLIAEQYGMTQVNHGISSTRMTEVAMAAIGPKLPGNTTGDRHYEAGTPGIVIIEAEQNDTLFGPYTDAGRLGFEHGLRAFIATVSAAQRIEAETATTTTGVWNTISNTRLSGGAALYSATTGSTLEFTGISSPTGEVFILTTANDAESSQTGTMTVDVDGVDAGISYVGQGQMDEFTSNVNGAAVLTYSNAVVRVPIPSTGTHSIKITATTDNAKNTFVDALLIPSETPPLVLVCKDPPIDSPPSTLERAQAFDTNSPIYNAIIDGVVGEFGKHVMSVDLAPGWDSMTMVASADAAKFHPNDLGMDLIASNISPAIDRLVSRQLVPPGLF